MAGDRDTGKGAAAFLGAIIGAAVGVGIGLLIAPEKGKTIRLRMAYHIDRLSQKVNEIGARMHEIQEESEARQTASDLVHGAQRQAEQIMRDANDLLNEIKRSTTGSRSGSR
jgi:gas vesicle protein